MVGVNFVSAQKVDTLFYDKNWKGVEIKQFASFVRYALYPKDVNARKLCRDYYVTGELQGESGFISIDKNDDSKSVFDGEVIVYFKDGKKSEVGKVLNGVPYGKYIMYYENGKKKSEGNFEKGVPQGGFIMYYENGKKKVEGNYDNGKLDGLKIVYFENGNKQLESIYKNNMENGKFISYKENGNICELRVKN
jgi:antitoxin component YwqK of YwqJK toxin-antitoxin module